MHPGRPAFGVAAASLAAKVAFLGRSDAYPERPAEVTCRQSQMSWIFIAGDIVYKLKKPVRLSYLDYSTIERREAACRAELALNRELAPDVYRGVVPLTAAADGLAIGGSGAVVDWLVVMRRLPEERTLARGLVDGSAGPREIDRLAEALVAFYRRARPAHLSPAASLGEWRRRLGENRGVLFDPVARLDVALLARLGRTQRRFLVEGASLLADRTRYLVDGHGDLRPEHIFLGEPVAIIDRLEFSRRFRIVDPFDELASLAVECALSGSSWAGSRVVARVGARLDDHVPQVLMAFYASYRATLRARLAIAHLLEPDGRPRNRWPALARRYLTIALDQAKTVAAFLDRRRRRHLSEYCDAG